MHKRGDDNLCIVDKGRMTRFSLLNARCCVAANCAENTNKKTAVASGSFAVLFNFNLAFKLLFAVFNGYSGAALSFSFDFAGV